MFEKYIERQAEYELSKNKIEMSDHNFQTGDSMGAVISICATLLFIVGLGTIAAVVAIASGTISIIINYPKFKAALVNLFKRKNKTNE